MSPSLPCSFLFKIVLASGSLCMCYGVGNDRCSMIVKLSLVFRARFLLGVSRKKDSSGVLRGNWETALGL